MNPNDDSKDRRVDSWLAHLPVRIVVKLTVLVIGGIVAAVYLALTRGF